LFLFPLTSFLRPTNHKAIGAKVVTVHGCFHYLWFPSRVIGGVIGKRARDSSSLSTSRPPASLPPHRSSSAVSVHLPCLPCALPPPTLSSLRRPSASLAPPTARLPTARGRPLRHPPSVYRCPAPEPFYPCRRRPSSITSKPNIDPWAPPVLIPADVRHRPHGPRLRHRSRAAAALPSHNRSFRLDTVWNASDSDTTRNMRKKAL
jgi:hypothetical protein